MNKHIQELSLDKWNKQRKKKYFLQCKFISMSSTNIERKLKTTMKENKKNLY